jgi:hypothetical protein
MLKKNSIFTKINSLDRGEVLFFSGLILVLTAGWVIAQDGGAKGYSYYPSPYAQDNIQSIDYQWDQEALEVIQSAGDPEPGTSDCCTRGQGQNASSGCGGGCGSGAGTNLEELKVYIYQNYAPALGEDIQVDIRDYGCHQEVDVIKDGQVVKRLVVSGGYITEIGT